jgi:hypothetical protein
MEFENLDKAHNLSSGDSVPTVEAGRQNLSKHVDWLDVKRGCCGTLLIFLLIIGCLAINMVTHF